MKVINENIVFLPFFFIFILLSALYSHEIVHYSDFVDWQTIVTLAGLLIITTAIKESAYFSIVAEKILKKANTERKVALLLILLSCILSSFLTNDIALFIVVPLTLSFRRFIGSSMGKLIIFEAIAVNVGSALTPIGNPQNLFLWHQWDVSFLTFVMKMLPLFVLLFALLIIFVLIIFPSKKLSAHSNQEKIKFGRKLFLLSILLLAGYVIIIQFGLAYYALPVVFLVYLAFYRNILPKVDWLLILLFVTIFVDFHLISRMQIILNFVNLYDLNSHTTVFSLSILFSQITSNVPASIFMSKFSHNWLSIAYGVNVGGNGTVIASLANIIALRFAGGKKIWMDFHKYSLLYLIVTGGLAYAVFFL
ncbi:MAG: citrate transporter [Thermoplasmata archaeon]|nr:citrate transporter [Thermoplasmata archaeon]